MEGIGVRAAFERVCAMEAEHDLLRYEVHGWAVWPLLRPMIARSFSRPGLAAAGAMSRATRWRLLARDLPRLLRPRRAELLAMTYTSGLSEREGERFKDQWFDDLLSRTGSFYKVEGVNNPAFLERSARALLPRDITPLLLQRIAHSRAKSRPVPPVEPPIDGLLRALENELGPSVARDEQIRATVAEFVQMKRLYGWLLGRVRPQAVLVADYGEYALVAAARGRGIETVELQHGINDRFHPAYSWTAYAAPHRARMPLPGRHFLYGEHWKREMAGGDFWGDALRVVGSPRIDGYRARRSAAPSDDCLNLTFTAQGIGSEATLDFLARSLRELPADRPLHLFIKPHPIYDSGSPGWWEIFGRDPRVEIVPANEGPSTFELLARSHVHLSVASATHYDALGIGVPTVILPMEHGDVVEPLHRAGHAPLVNSPSELASAIQERAKGRVPREVSNYYYAPGAVDAMLEELRTSGRRALLRPATEVTA
jgi:hypothetical protein